MRVQTERRDEVAILTMDDGRVNALGADLATDLADALDAARDARAVVIAGKPLSFSAGLDL